jgi:hypothetical protein
MSLFVASDEAPFVFGAYASHLSQPAGHASVVDSVDDAPEPSVPDEPAAPAPLDARSRTVSGTAA